MRSVAQWVLAGAVLLSAESVTLPPGLDPQRMSPASNPASRAKIALGRRIFFDTAFSRGKNTSCASCHDPQKAFTDGRSAGVGTAGARTERSVPTLISRAWGNSFFWDGRVATLEQQALRPLLNPREMGMSRETLLAVIRGPGYRGAFASVFASEPGLDQLALAVASYVRTIVAGDSPYDRFEAGDRGALAPPAIRGLFLFRQLAGCRPCHNGPNLTDESFHNTGIAWRSGKPRDIGRMRVTHDRKDHGSFKTPTLREISRTGPYMHDGSLSSLEAVIDYYDRGGQPNPALDERIQPVHLSPGQKEDILAFLLSLSGQINHGE